MVKINQRSFFLGGRLYKEMNFQHTPVLLAEVIKYLAPKPGDKIIDCTFGGGGFSFAVAKAIMPDGKILAIDWDEKAIAAGRLAIKQNKINNIILVRGNFKDLPVIIEKNWLKEKKEFNGILFDLGLSSFQLADASRGFSFQRDLPLDMAFGKSGQEDRKTEKIVNYWPLNRLSSILKEYGEEKYAERIARNIVLARKKQPIRTTGKLVEIIRNSVPRQYRKRKTHFATKTFQALRIATNDELNNLETALPIALAFLAAGGKIIVLSYHSLEDRIVKNFFKKESRNCLCAPTAPTCVCGHQAHLKIITKKPVIPSVSEIAANRRARSAKMRVGEKI